MTSSHSSPVTAAGDLATLLNRAELKFSKELGAAPPHSDRAVVKYLPGRRYLVLLPAQLRLLEEFGAGRTVTSVLCDAIAAQRCPSLREFYELVVKAVRAGVLQAEAHPLPPPDPPADWGFRFSGEVVRWLTLVFVVAAAVSIVWHPPLMPQHPAWLVLGWLAACAAVSAGAALGAAVLRAAGGEIYHPRFAWKTLLPGFQADLDDVVMVGKPVAINIGLARLVPWFIFMTAATWFAPELMVPLVAGLLWQLAPFGQSPAQDLLVALYRDPQLTTAYDFVFARDRLITLLTQARKRIAGGRYLLACALATVAWLLLVFLSGCVMWQANAVELLRRFQAAGGWRYTALGLLVFFGLLVVGTVGTAVWIVFSHVRAWWRERAERRQHPQAVLVSATTIADWLGRTLLFRDLPPADLEALAASIKPQEFKRGSFVVREGEPGTQLFVVLSGHLEVRRDFAPGRSEPVAEMGEGDVFGEIALLQGGPRTRSIRCLARSTLLVLDKADFERLVLSRMSRQAVEDAVQKVGFLQHARLTRHWDNQMMAAFARRSKLQEMPEGTVILEEGSSNHWFYLVHRGELEVSQKGQVLRRLKMGDSFGELSLMGDGFVTARVIVRSKMASCLMINGRDFLEFITQDFTVGLEWEEAKTRRLERLSGKE